MRIWLFSDIHSEKGDFDLEGFLAQEVNADMCIIPGDLHNGAEAVSVLSRDLAKRMPVVYVPGNHDYAHCPGSLADVDAQMQEIAQDVENLHVLNPGSVVIDGVKFIGASFWTDFALMGSETIEGAMNSGRRKFGPLKHAGFGPEQARAVHLEHKAFIERELMSEEQRVKIVVTHHAPHPGCAHPRHGIAKGDLLNATYVSDQRELILRTQPDFWLHGHVHDSVDLLCGSTRIVANPMGYRVRIEERDGVSRTVYTHDPEQEDGEGRRILREGYENARFQPVKILDIPSSGEDARFEKGEDEILRRAAPEFDADMELA